MLHVIYEMRVLERQGRGKVALEGLGKGIVVYLGTVRLG